MAKIIVEQVQGGSGGTALTVPTAAATVNNQAVVGSTAGVLSHSPIALPAAASGAANRPLVGATTGATTFSPIAMPASDGTANQYLQTNGSGQLGFNSITESSLLPEDNDLMIGAIFTTSMRENFYSTGTWSTSGPNSTYYNSLSDASAIQQCWNMAFADGKPKASGVTNSTGDITYSNNDDGEARTKLFAHNRRLGWVAKQWERDYNQTSYSGITISILPIRNKGSSAVDVSLKRGFTSQSNYSGSGIVSYRPTYSSGTNYANATGGAWTTHNSYTSNTSYAGSNNTNTINIPAGQTVLVMMTSSHIYHTTDFMHDIHVYAELQTAFTHTDIQCDMRMLEALHTCRQPAADYNTQTPYEMYTSCATCYGDR
jgi:hypothetical protein